jgi:hypothetical protein
MAGASVNLPAVGPVSRRALLIGGGLSVAVVAVVWWRRRTAAPAPSDPNAADVAGIDSGVTDTGAGTGVAGGGSSGAGSTSSGALTSNAQWVAMVTESLSGVVDPSALAQALGLYVTGQAVTKDQELIIDQAIAYAGWPPVAGPNGYPPAIRQSPATGQTPPPAAGTTKRVNVDAGWPVNQWIRDLQAGKEGPVAAHTSFNDVLRLNGGKGGRFDRNIRWNLPSEKRTFINSDSYIVGH